jgi:hypothetical protein
MVAPTGLLGWPATAVVGLAAMLLTWRWQAWPPVHAGLSSWQAGLSLAFLRHLQWGPQALFTFGPYGFLEEVEPFGRLTAGLALAYGFASRAGLACLVVSALRRSSGLVLAGAGAWLAVGVAANLAEAPELATAVALALALRALGASRERQTNTLAHLSLLALLGALAGFQLLVEVNLGLVCTGLALAAASFSAYGRRARAWAVTSAALVGTAVLALVAAGQSLANLPSYFRGELAVVLGYTQAMSLSEGRTAEDLFALVGLALLASLTAWALRGLSWQQKLAISLCLAGWAWELAKEGYVRHDLHDLTFLGLMAPALALVSACAGGSGTGTLARTGHAREPAAPRWLAVPRWLIAGAQLGAVGTAAALACTANAGPPASLVSPVESVRSLASQVVDLSSTDRWAEVETAAKRQAKRTGDALSGRVLNALALHSFAVEPLEDSLSFAYPALKQWDPEPVLQAYSAYTPYLDDLDAAFLASRRAPELILYRPISTSGFDPAWEPPAATEALYCHYAQMLTAGYWALLRRVPGRCGHPVAMGRVTAHFGEPVSVPAGPAGDMVVARFSLRLPATTGIENIVSKAPAVYSETWAAGPLRGPATWRFVVATAGQDHVLYAPPALGWASGYGPQAVNKLCFTGGGWRSGTGTVEVSFFAVPLAKAPA